MAYCDINAEESGTLQNLDFLTSLQQKEGVVWARPYIRAGSQAGKMRVIPLRGKFQRFLVYG